MEAVIVDFSVVVAVAFTDIFVKRYLDLDGTTVHMVLVVAILVYVTSVFCSSKVFFILNLDLLSN